eukprot:11197108-Lingulodinium_polyedra.AAC.1
MHRPAASAPAGGPPEEPVRGPLALPAQAGLAARAAGAAAHAAAAAPTAPDRAFSGVRDTFGRLSLAEVGNHAFL